MAGPAQQQKVRLRRLTNEQNASPQRYIRLRHILFNKGLKVTVLQCQVCRNMHKMFKTPRPLPLLLSFPATPQQQLLQGCYATSQVVENIVFTVTCVVLKGNI